MEAKKLSFGEAVADVAERRAQEQEMFGKKWATVDVQWWEMRLQQERDKAGRGEEVGTFYRDRNEMQVEAFRMSHDRGDFKLPEEMSRGEFAAFNSTELDPLSGQEKPLPNPPTEADVFDRPEVSALMARIIDAQSKWTDKGRGKHAATEPISWLVTKANRKGLIMGHIPGVVSDRIRDDFAKEALNAGRVAFRGETPESREARVERLFKLAGEAVAMRAELQQAATELAGAEQLGGRVFDSSRPVIVSAIRDKEREASKLGPFAPWILEGDELKRLRDQLARIDQAIEQAKKKWSPTLASVAGR